jgi:hypothetical protein
LNKKDHQKSKQALIALTTNNTPGLPCLGRLESPTTFPCNEHVFEAYYKMATAHLLNYNSHVVIAAVQMMHDRNNPNSLPETVPAALSQLSYLPSQDN